MSQTRYTQPRIRRHPQLATVGGTSPGTARPWHAAPRAPPALRFVRGRAASARPDSEPAPGARSGHFRGIQAFLAATGAKPAGSGGCGRWPVPVPVPQRALRDSARAAPAAAVTCAQVRAAPPSLTGLVLAGPVRDLDDQELPALGAAPHRVDPADGGALQPHGHQRLPQLGVAVVLEGDALLGAQPPPPAGSPQRRLCSGPAGSEHRTQRQQQHPRRHPTRLLLRQRRRHPASDGGKRGGKREGSRERGEPRGGGAGRDGTGRSALIRVPSAPAQGGRRGRMVRPEPLKLLCEKNAARVRVSVFRTASLFYAVPAAANAK